MRGSITLSIALMLVVCACAVFPAAVRNLYGRQDLSRAKRMSMIIDASHECREQAMPCIFALDATMMPNNQTAQQACRSLQGFYNCVATAISDCADPSVTAHWHQMGDALNCSAD